MLSTPLSPTLTRRLSNNRRTSRLGCFAHSLEKTQEIATERLPTTRLFSSLIPGTSWPGLV